MLSIASEIEILCLTLCAFLPADLHQELRAKQSAAAPISEVQHTCRQLVTVVLTSRRWWQVEAHSAASGGFADVWAQRSTPREYEQPRSDGYDQYDQAQYQARWAQAHHDDREEKLEATFSLPLFSLTHWGVAAGGRPYRRGKGHDASHGSSATPS